MLSIIVVINMSKIDRCFEDFTVGDYVTFNRSFCDQDFESFSELSRDANPLHHDERYATATQFGKIIVPLHLVTSPFSAIAGMMLPGHRSLYLGLEVKALHPVFYDEAITYSAKVIQLNEMQKVLSLRVILLQRNRVVLEAKMKVKVRYDVQVEYAPSHDQECTIHNPKQQKRAIITGSNGEIGQTIALKMAKEGWNLILHCHRKGKGGIQLVNACQSNGVKADLLEGDLTEIDSLCRSVEKYIKDTPISALIHTASPPVMADPVELFEVNYVALKGLVNVLLPSMLRQQYGKLIFLGSSAVQYHLEGWEHYIAAKTVATNYLEGINFHYRTFDVSAHVLAPGYVDTSFSRSFRKPDDVTLMPEEVAETVATIIKGDIKNVASYTWIEPDFSLQGDFGFHHTNKDVVLPTDPQAGSSAEIPVAQPGSTIESIVRNFLKLSANHDLTDGGLNLTPGWDSLRHIELCLYLEDAFYIKFVSNEISQTTRFKELKALITSKTANKS